MGPSIILAGAGSGKTRVLTYKAMYLIESRACLPDEILMLTFTNKAAAEMKKRILNTIQGSKKPELITAQTFHSFCATTLRRNGRPSSTDRDFTILDTDDQKDLLKDIITESGKSSSLKPGTLLYAISEAKNKLISPHSLMEQSTDFFQEQIAKLYGQYQKRLQEVRGIDFDDLLVETVQLITDNTQVRLYFQNRFKQVLVDEYQDTNHVQYVLAKLLSEKRRNITIVGDFSQSIYSWRGADFHNLEKFKIDFTDAVTFHLEQNYRSTQPILDVAFSIISKNESHPILKLWTNKKKGEEIHIMSLENAEEEALYIVNKIRTLKEMESIPLSEIAILYRTNAQSRLFEEVCLHLGIPYKIFGGTRFYERKEVKDVLAFVRYLKNDSDAT
ncbi:MAG: UvrD-helicase domain-containing protein, partial [Patescibacteria group bacterium]